MADETKAEPKTAPGTTLAVSDQSPKTMKRTPDAWARALGMFQPRNPAMPQSVDNYAPKHAAADELYGWSDYAYHYQAEADRFELTEVDYRRALEAAAWFPTVAPHAPALTPLRAAKFKNFQPRAALKGPGAEAEKK